MLNQNNPKRYIYQNNNRFIRGSQHYQTYTPIQYQSLNSNQLSYDQNQNLKQSMNIHNSQNAQPKQLYKNLSQQNFRLQNEEQRRQLYQSQDIQTNNNFNSVSEKLKMQKDQILQEKRLLEQHVQFLDTQNKKLLDENQVLKNDPQRLQSQLEDQSVLALERKDKDIDILRKEIQQIKLLHNNQMRAFKDRKEENIWELKKEIEFLKDENEELKTQIESNQNNLNQLQQDNQQNSTNYQNEQQQIEYLQNEIQLYKGDVEIRDKEIQNLKQINNQLQFQLNQLGINDIQSITQQKNNDNMKLVNGSFTNQCNCYQCHNKQQNFEKN